MWSLDKFEIGTGLAAPEQGMHRTDQLTAGWLKTPFFGRTEKWFLPRHPNLGCELRLFGARDTRAVRMVREHDPTVICGDRATDTAIEHGALVVTLFEYSAGQVLRQGHGR